MKFALLVLVVLVLGVPPAQAETAPPLPFNLKDAKEHRLIPNGLGMKFFQGKWDYLDGSGSIPATVTDKAFINDALNHAKPYRVLIEAPHYVLLAVLMAPDKDGFIKIPWTDFVVLTLKAWKISDPYSKSAHMIYHICGLESMFGSAHAFSWSREKLLNVFRQSWCFSGIHLERKNPFYEHWSGSKYQRQ